MLRHVLPLAVCAVLSVKCPLLAADEAAPLPAFDLTPHLKAGDAAEVGVTLEVGGELIVPSEEGEPTKVPLSVMARLAYAEQLVSWSAEAPAAARSLRHYSTANATIKTDTNGVQRDLPAENSLIVAELSDAGSAMTGLTGPLTRDQFDLVDLVGNTLALDRLLPHKALQEGEGWDHDASVIGALLGMDHVAVCEVRSVVTGEGHRQVQIRMAGTVHGTVDGAATEMELRAAYLYHLDRGRITKCNLAIKEHRKPGDASAGLDVVAKLSIGIGPALAGAAFDEASVKRATDMTRAELRQLLVDAPRAATGSATMCPGWRPPSSAS